MRDKGKRKRPKVVEHVFSEPGLPAKRARKPEPGGEQKNGKKRQKKGTQGPRRRGLAATAEPSEFKDAWRSVNALAASSLTGRRKRERESEVLLALGAKAVKRKSMPLKMLRGIKAKREERATRQAQELKDSGVVSGHASRRSSVGNGSGKSATSSQRQRDRGLDSGVFRDGGESCSAILFVCLRCKWLGVHATLASSYCMTCCCRR